ncbi:MAG: RHS repeat domain-containing protein, partial [Pirellula sp.]
GINLIASIDSVSEEQFTASFFGSTKALHGEVATTSPATTTHNHSNQQYSITAITTSAGAVAERYAYSAYGEPTICDSSGSVIAGSAINNRYSYTGREWDATVGLHHFRARWISPKTGRFMGRDPIAFEGGAFNISEYCHDSPFNYIDPSGQQIRPNPAVPWAPYPYPSSPLPPPSPPQPAPPPLPATPQPPSTTPPPRAEYCGPLRMKCPPPADIDNVEASVIGNSPRAAAILAMGGMTGGCVTFPSGIECTMSCQALKTTMSGDNPKQLILAHEACHYCALKLLTGTRCGEAGLIPFLGTITPAPDPCVGRERPITIGWR